MARRKKKELEVNQEPEKVLEVTQENKEIVINSNVRLTGVGRKSVDVDCKDEFQNVPGIVRTILATKEYGYGVMVEPIQEIRWFKKEDIGFFD